MRKRLFPALLKFWRSKRGFSQIDLAYEAGVSPRHISFLESARAKPSEEMTLLLMSVLRIPLREQNEMLRAAGFSARYAEGDLPSDVSFALDQMLKRHDPYPMTVVGMDGAIVRANASAPRVFTQFMVNATSEVPDMFAMVFDPNRMRPFIANWNEVASSIINRLHRERLERVGDERIASALERALSYPGVPEAWRMPDFTKPVAPAMTIRLTRDGKVFSVLVTTTTFSAPQQVTLEELRIESCLPLDEQTDAFMKALAAS